MAYHFPGSFLLFGFFLSVNLYLAMIVGFCGNGGLALRGGSVCGRAWERLFLVYNRFKVDRFAYRLHGML